VVAPGKTQQSVTTRVQFTGAAGYRGAHVDL